MIDAAPFPCPDCGLPISPHREGIQFASMGDMRRVQRAWVEHHKKKGECLAPEVAPYGPGDIGRRT